MNISSKRFSGIMFVLLVLMIFTVMYVIGLRNYLLFHILAEFFSIVIAFSVFIIVWNGKSYLKNNYLLLLGIAYLFIGFLDLLHVIGYKGMNILDYDFYANQLWIAARGLEAATLFFGLFLVSREKLIRMGTIIIVYCFVTALLIYSIFFSDIFPVCFIEGEGQTIFKIASEYVINLVLIITLILLYFRKNRFTADTFKLLVLSIIFTIIAELAFTFYVSNYGISNMLGHYAKIISFYFIYKGLIRINIIEPYDSIFSELTTQGEELRKADNMKTHLLSIISHDLRGPLSGVAGIAAALDGDYRALTPEESKIYISDLRIAVDNTAALVENLLDWSRIELEGHQTVIEEYNLAKLLNESVTPLNFSYRLKNMSIDLRADEDLPIFVDRNSFMIIIRNILSNSLKFSEEGSTVTVEAGAGDGASVIKIIDRGTGMNFSSELFHNPVNSTKTGTNNEKGSGLGLYMIKKYTEENNGTVDIESTPGEGTTVTLKFPLSPE